MCYTWTYSWDEIIKLYKSKAKVKYVTKKQDYEFLMELAKAALGGGSSNSPETIGLYSGEGLDEFPEDKLAILKEALGEDFDKMGR